MKQFRLREARTRSVSARDSSPRTDSENSGTAYQNCSLLVSVMLATIGEGGWRRFELEHFTVAAKAFFDLCLPLLTTRLIVALFVSAVFGVLGQNLSSGVINLVIDCREFGVVAG